MHRRRALEAIGTALAAGLSGCLSGSVLGSTEYDVGMTATAFEPLVYEATVGERVVWDNTSSRGHTVTAYDSGLPEGAAYFASGGFESESAARAAWQKNRAGNFYSGDTYEHVFEVPGTYTYFCIPHERGGMVGQVNVLPQD